MATQISPATVQHIGQLANIPLTTEEEKKFAAAFSETLEVVSHMSELDTSKTEPTHQVTGLENIWREDQATGDQTFTQAQALANAKHTHDGYFVVPQIIDQD